MIQRACAWLLGLSLLVPIAGRRVESTWAREERDPGDADLAQFLEGLAPLAEHGGWTRTEMREGFAGTLGYPTQAPAEGLQDALRVEFSVPDKSRMMAFLAARFETAAQAEEFLAAAHASLLRQFEASGPHVSEWLYRVSKGAGQGGTLDGHAIDWVVQFFRGVPVRFALQHFHVGRLVVTLSFVGCSHLSRDTQDAFIAHALERLTNPAAERPPSPDMRVATREVTISLRDPAGEPVASAEATTQAVGSEESDPAVQVRDRETVTLPREYVKFRVGHATGPDGRPLPLLAEEIVLDPQQTEVTLTLPRGDPCRVRVLGPEGEPIPGAGVRTLSNRFPSEPLIEIRVAGETVPQEEKFPPIGDGKATTDARGEVWLPLDPRHGSRIAVDAGEDFAPKVEEVSPGAKSRTLRLRAAWVLHLEVQDQEGAKVEGDVEVRVGGGTRFEETDGVGQAHIGPLPREAVHVRAAGDWAEQESWTEVKPTRDRVVLTVRSHVLRLRVLDAGGAPVPRYWVEVRTPHRGQGRSAEGPITLLVPNERYTVEVREAVDADGRPLNLAAVGAWVTPEARELTLHMEPGIKMTGTVRTADARPVADARVMAVRAHNVHARAQTDAEGRYELVGLDSGVVSVKVRPPDGYAPPRPRDVSPSGTAGSIDFTLPEVVPITVLDWRGRPVHGAWVRVKVIGEGPEAGTYPIDHHTNEDGVAYLANLYPDQELHVTPQNSKDLASLRQAWNGSKETLRLERAHTVQVRIVDGLGPVAGARIDVEGGEDYSEDSGPEGRSDVILPYRPMRLRAQRSTAAPWSEWVVVGPREVEVEVRLSDAAR